MDPVFKSIQEYIKSGEYFTDAKNWYKYKYIYPFAQRSVLLIFTCILVIVFSQFALNISLLFPIAKKISYYLYSQNSYQSSANIIRADQVNSDPLGSITDIMIRNYVINREKYDYDLLKEQILFIQNNSTRIVFRKFSNYMDIDNPLSPILRYQKYTRRSVNILSTKYPSDDEGIVKFESIARSNGGEIIENMVWQATVNYEIDKISLNLPHDTRFNFAVTNYKLKLLEDKNNK